MVKLDQDRNSSKTYRRAFGLFLQILLHCVGLLENLIGKGILLEIRTLMKDWQGHSNWQKWEKMCSSSSRLSARFSSLCNFGWPALCSKWQRDTVASLAPMDQLTVLSRTLSFRVDHPTALITLKWKGHKKLYWDYILLSTNLLNVEYGPNGLAASKLYYHMNIVSKNQHTCLILIYSRW